jgi:HK97 gp10 family phage protein
MTEALRILTVEVSTRGLQFNSVLDKLSKELRQKFIERLADIAWASAFYGAPWKTGKLAGSIVKEVSGDEAEVQALAPYAVFVELGTAPHEIRPVNASVLAFEAAGKMVFTPIVRHPGTKPNPFMERAAEDTRSKAEAVFADLWLELIG